MCRRAKCSASSGATGREEHVAQDSLAHHDAHRRARHHARARGEPAGGRHRVSSRAHGARERLSERHAARDAVAGGGGGFDEICEFAGVGPYIDTPIKRYSSGNAASACVRRRCASCCRHDHRRRGARRRRRGVPGEVHARDACGAERRPHTLFVSHNLALVENLCTRAMLLERGRVTGIGSSEAIVGQYLRGAMSVGGACVDYMAEETESSSRVCWILAARMRGTNDGAPIQGEEARLTVDISVRDSRGRWGCWIGLATVEGERVAALNSSDYRNEWTLPPGRIGSRSGFPSCDCFRAVMHSLFACNTALGRCTTTPSMRSRFRCSSAMSSVLAFLFLRIGESRGSRPYFGCKDVVLAFSNRKTLNARTQSHHRRGWLHWQPPGGVPARPRGARGCVGQLVHGANAESSRLPGPSRLPVHHRLTSLPIGGGETVKSPIMY